MNTSLTIANRVNANALAIRRRARGLNIDSMSDSDAVDAFVGVVNSLLFHTAEPGGSMKNSVQVRWASPDQQQAGHDGKHNVITLPWPGPAVDAEKYLALRGYALQEFGRMQLSHPELMTRLNKNGGKAATAVASIIEARRIHRDLNRHFGRTYQEAFAQIVSDCTPTPEQQAQFDAADVVSRLLNDFTIIARELPYQTSSASSVVDRLRKWVKLADAQGVTKGAGRDEWGFQPAQRVSDRAPTQYLTSWAQHTADLTQIFLTAFKDIFDQAPPDDQPDQQDPNGQPDPNGKPQSGQGNASGGSGNSQPSMQDQLNQGMQSTADKQQYHQCVQDPTDAQQDVAGNEGHQTGSSSDFGNYRRVAGMNLPDVLRRRGARVASTLRRALAAKSRFGDETDMDDGDLDPDKLPEIARGKWETPFMRPGRIIHDRDTAVHICLDGSGSMSSPPSEGLRRWVNTITSDEQLAREPQECIDLICKKLNPDAAGTLQDLAAEFIRHTKSTKLSVWDMIYQLMQARIWISGASLAVHDALRTSRIAHEVSAFSGPYVVLKNWKQRGFPAGGTPAGSSWKNSLGSLLKRRETRRILIVMSDGEIEDDEANLGRAVIQTARELGIECYGFGIMSSGVARVFPRNDKSVSTVEYGDDLNRRLQDLVHGILTHAGKDR
jgi:hypothetical protein